MSGFDIVDLPDGTYDVFYDSALIGNYSTHREALRTAISLHLGMTR